VLAVSQGDAVDLPYAVMERTVTTAGGKYAFDTLVNGANYLIFARAPDGQIGTAIQIPAPTKDQKIKVGTRFSVFGTVVDDESGDALEDVVLYAILARDKSDESGRFELDGLIRQNPFPQIWVRADGYEDKAINLELGLKALFATKVEKNIRLTKLVPATVRATVRDTNGSPVAGAKVTIRHWGEEEDIAAGTTDDSGVATLTGVPPRGVLVLAKKEGYVLAQLGSARSGEPTAYATEYQWTSVDPGETADVTLSMIRVGKATGTVMDRGGKPLAGVVLSTNAGKLGQTDAKGKFSVDGVPEGMRTSVLFRKTGYVDQWLTFEAMQRESIEVVMSRGATVAGIVTDEAGKPVGGVNITAIEVEFRSEEQMAQSDPEGRFRIEGLDPGDYSLRLARDGYASARSERMSLGEAETVEDLVLTISTGIRISLKLLHPGGEEVRGSILLYGPLGKPKDERHLRRQYVRPGREIAFNVLPGLYRILASPARNVTDAGATEYEHQINGAGEVRVELKTEVARLLVKPNLPSGTKMGSVMLMRTEPDEPSVQFWFNDQEDGVFRSPPVPPGTYTLGFWFRGPDADSWEYKEIEGLEPGNKVREVDLK
jgi:protocatechuate 3,4-dioxygenase beta subunit